MPSKSPSHRRVSYGTGQVTPDQFAKLGAGVILEPGALVFHPERIEIGDHVYVGHYAILHGYPHTMMVIGQGSWIGAHCFLHSAGGLVIGPEVGIGPGVKILTSAHGLEKPDKPILHGTLQTAPVSIGEGADVGAGAVILPGVRIGRGVQVGAGAVVTSDVADYAVVAGVPARVLRMRA